MSYKERNIDVGQAVTDLTNRTLARLPSDFSRLVYLASSRELQQRTVLPRWPRIFISAKAWLESSCRVPPRDFRPACVRLFGRIDCGAAQLYFRN